MASNGGHEKVNELLLEEFKREIEGGTFAIAIFFAFFYFFDKPSAPLVH